MATGSVALGISDASSADASVHPRVHYSLLLENRASCRFFFPWPEHEQQQYCETTQRLALQRRHASDDQFVVPHNLELALFSPATVNVMLFDYLRGADQCRSYACKYCGKPEPWYFLPTSGGEANPVKRFLQTRNVGMCMCHNRILGNHVVRSTVSTLYVWPQFTVDPSGRERRPPEHLANCPKYPDSEYWLNEVQHYFFRNTQLRHLRVAQFVRYFARKLEKRGANSRKVRTDENTIDEDVEGVA